MHSTEKKKVRRWQGVEQQGNRNKAHESPEIPTLGPQKCTYLKSERTLIADWIGLTSFPWTYFKKRPDLNLAVFKDSEVESLSADWKCLGASPQAKLSHYSASCYSSYSSTPDIEDYTFTANVLYRSPLWLTHLHEDNGLLILPHLFNKNGKYCIMN